MLSSLMPQRKEFYVLLATLSDRVVAGANATLRLLNGLGNNAEDLPTLVADKACCKNCNSFGAKFPGTSYSTLEFSIIICQPSCWITQGLKRVLSFRVFRIGSVIS